MFNKHYLIKPSIFAFISSSISICFFVFAKYCVQTIDSIARSIISIGTTFSLTFIAFSVAALALLQLIQSQNWYEAVSKTKDFKSFISRLFLSIYMSFVLCAVSLFDLFIVDIDIRHIKEVVVTVSIFLMAFILVWIFECIHEFMQLFKK
jgi:hypothetical protein